MERNNSSSNSSSPMSSSSPTAFIQSSQNVTSPPLLITSSAAAVATKSTPNNNSPGDNISQLSQPNSDISSFSNVELSVEKYQRLASEFAKLRSQFIILKKAVVEEQGKNSELQESLKRRDQSVRRLEQESESLMFRNKQLTKRIAVLQTDLEQDSGASQKRNFLFSSGDVAKNRSSSNASNASSVPSVVEQTELLDEINHELKTKIEENERLRELVHEIDDKRDDELKLLERRLKECEANAERRLETLHDEIRSMSNTVLKSNAEKDGLQDKLSQLQQQLRETQDSMESLKQENSQLKSRIVISEKQLVAAKQHARLVQHQQQSTHHLQPPTSSHEGQSYLQQKQQQPQLNGIPRSGSFSGIIRSSGSFTLRPLPRSGSLSITSNQSESLANLIASAKRSQSTKDISKLSNSVAGNAGGGDQTSPSHSSKSYRDVGVKQHIIGEFAIKISEIICALSTLHSNASKKISILFAHFNNNVNHLYFFDLSGALTIPNSVLAHERIDNASVPLNRSSYILTILRKLSDYLKSGYDTHLVNLEEATHQFLTAKIRFYQQQAASDESSSAATSEISLITAEIQQHATDIIEKFNDYISYLNKINPYISLCLNFWCNNLRAFNPNDAQMIKMIGSTIKTTFADDQTREQLCSKHEQLCQSVTNYVRIAEQICHYIKSLLSQSLLNQNCLNMFNHFLHRVNALEKSSDQMKQIFSSKVALEYKLGITTDPDLLAVDDCILSSMVFFRKSIVDLRLMLEMHYFFFVDNRGGNDPHSATAACGDGRDIVSSVAPSDAVHHTASTHSASPMLITDQGIPEEDDEDMDDDEEDDGGDEPNDADGEFEEVENENEDHNEKDIQTTAKDATTQIDPNEINRLSVKVGDANANGSHSNDEVKQLEEKNQLARYHRQLDQFKQEKEHWTIECELNQLKLEQEQRKVSELECRVQSLMEQLNAEASKQKPSSDINANNHPPQQVTSSQSLNRANSNSNSLASSSGKSLDTNAAELGSISSASLQSPTLDCFGTVHYPAISDQVQSQAVSLSAYHATASINGPTEPTQVLTNEYLHSKVAKLFDELQLADGRAAAYQQECSTLKTRYLHLNREKAELNRRFTEQERTMSLVQEEYRTSVENYEIQLRTMSEHMAQMNERLAAQTEEIEILKYNQQQQQQQQSSGKTSSTSSVAKTFRRGFSSGNSKS